MLLAGLRLQSQCCQNGQRCSVQDDDIHLGAAVCSGFRLQGPATLLGPKPNEVFRVFASTPTRTNIGGRLGEGAWHREKHDVSAAPDPEP